MITRKLLIAVFLLMSGAAFAQIEPVINEEWIPESRMDQHESFMNGDYAFPAKPRNMWQIGLHLGLPQISGDVRSEPFPQDNHGIAWGAGLNIRKGLGYVTSLRLNGMYGYAYGQDYVTGAKNDNKVLNGQFATNDPAIENYSDGANYKDSIFVYNYKTKLMAGNLDLMFNLNNINFHKAEPKMLFYTYVGVGILVYNTLMDAGTGNTDPYDGVAPDPYDFANDVFAGADPTVSQNDEGEIDRRLEALHGMLDGEYETQAETASQKRSDDKSNVYNPAVSAGLGLSWRLGNRCELGVEHRISYYFDDLADGERWGDDGQFTPHNDLLQYTQIVFGVSLGSKSDISTWEKNPLNFVYNKLSEIDPANLLKDSDDDGVIDYLDREANTPAGTPVDTHGVSLDSDKDGCKDSEDPEPFSTPNLPIENCQNVWLDRDDVQTMIDDAFNKRPIPTGSNWYLPMIFFDLDKYNIRPEAVPQLEYVAEIMTQYPKLNIEVVGHTDTRASESYNLKLSENRAKEAINYLTSKKGISQGRFIMKYSGEADNLIPNARNEAEHQQNRRVEFHIAK